MNHLPSNMASLALTKNKIRTRTDDDSDSDTDNELFLTKDNWPRFIVVQSASEERPLSKVSPFAVQKGFQAIAGTLKSTKRLRGGSFLVECSRKTQAENLLKTVHFVDRPVHDQHPVSDVQPTRRTKGNCSWLFEGESGTVCP